jgi:lipopolysaccharide transport system permease protein
MANTPQETPTPANASRRHGGILRLEPRSTWQTLNAREVWAYRDLLLILAWRDIKVRYKQTAVGALWALLQPAVPMVIFAVIFGYFANLPTDGLPYPIFFLAGWLPWQLFSFALTQSSNSLVDNERLVTKVYFPRLILPLASVISGLVDFAVALLLLVIAMVWYRHVPGPQVLLLPLLVIMVIATALAVGLWLSALSALYRDFRYAIPFLVMVWMYLSPIPYSSTMVPEQWRWLYGLNPMAGIIESFRLVLLGGTFNPWGMLAIGAVSTTLLLLTGAVYFRQVERTIADNI